MSDSLSRSTVYDAARRFIEGYAERFRNPYLGMLADYMEVGDDGRSSDPAMQQVFKRLVGDGLPRDRAFSALGEFLASELDFVDDKDVVGLIDQVRRSGMTPPLTEPAKIWLEILANSKGDTPT